MQQRQQARAAVTEAAVTAPSSRNKKNPPSNTNLDDEDDWGAEITDEIINNLPPEDIEDDQLESVHLERYHDPLMPYRYSNSKRRSSSSHQEETPYPMDDILVVAAVDGTLSGVSKSTGKTLWRRSRKDQPLFYKSKEQERSEAPLFLPLVSTTTTVQSSASGDWRTSAVPSTDGKVHLTAPLNDKKTRADGTAENGQTDEEEDSDEETADVTVTTTVSELVARSPFLDNRGRVYTGTRKSIAAAIDGQSGTILQVIAADQQCSTSMDSSQAVWLGRIDYGVSIQDPRSGLVDVQFSSGRIMSVKDMLLGSSSGSSQQRGQQQPWHSNGDGQTYMLPEGDDSTLPMLLATPSGALAYRDPVSGKISWIAEDYFDSPIAFAVDAASGSSLPVSIVQDAAVPGASSQHLMEEFERQLQLSSGHDDVDAQTIFSQLASGQLFAMPLGGSEARGDVIADGPAEISAPSTNHHEHCRPGLTEFPACLDNPMAYYGSFESKFLEGATQSTESDGAIIPFYHPDLGYIPPDHFYTLKQEGGSERRKYKRIFKILGSWLPPTIALIFVISFELGRRKRQKDSSKLGASNADLVKTSVDSLSKNEASTSQGVIQVCHDVILGYGGHGTVVFRGLLDGRQVAVKRMLKAYHASADREISLLIESDGHPNVVRYFLKEVRGDFVYLALELCDLSLHDFIAMLRNCQDERQNEPIAVSDALRRILLHIASGVRHLHSLRIVHRDLKPANILLADSRRTNKSAKATKKTDETALEIFEGGYYVAKISDMGLGKQLIGQSSFGASLINESSFRGASNVDKGSVAGAGPGSVGWQAPEVMARRAPSDLVSVRSDTSNPLESVSESSPYDVSGTTSTSRSVDIFSLGCIFYSTLVPGSHPFGEWYEREANIMHNKPCIDALNRVSVDAYDLVAAMIQRSPSARPTARQVCEHPFFWSPDRRLSFICEFSDRLETECDNSIKVAKLLAVEQGAVQVVGISWDTDLDPELVSNVQRFRTYDPSSVRDLLRLIRNKHHHFDELPPELKDSLESKTEGLMVYFEKLFPSLLIHCFRVCREYLPNDDPLSLKYCIGLYGSKRRQGVSTISEDEKAESITQDEDGSTVYTSRVVARNEELKTPDGVTSIVSNDKPVVAYSKPKDCLVPDPVPTLREHVEEAPEIGDVIIWHGSDLARKAACRGWNRSDGEWMRRVDTSLRKRNANLVRCKEDPKFRTRLCNHWDTSLGTFCPMRKKNKCDFAHGPLELRVKEAKRNRWGTLVDENGDNKNPKHSGGEDTYGAARAVETARKHEGKWKTDNKTSSSNSSKGKQRPSSGRKKK